MKKSNKFNLILGVLFISVVAVVFTTRSVLAEDSFSLEQPKDQTSSNNRQYDAEKEKALQAGFTEKQFEQIMNIPNVPAVNYSAPTNAAMTGDQTKVVNKAKEQIGKPYEWGASGPNSFDCGGLVKYVYEQAVNIDLPMGTYNQEKYGKEVSLNSLLPGDLLFYGDRGNTYHVGIYIGNNQMIHAPQPGQNVTTVDIKYFYPSFARRLLKDTPDPIPNTRDSQDIWTFWYGEGSNDYNKVINYCKSRNFYYETYKGQNGMMKIRIGYFNQASENKFALEQFLGENKLDHVVLLHKDGFFNNEISNTQWVESYWYGNGSSDYNKVLNFIKDKNFYYEIIPNPSDKGLVKIKVGYFQLNSKNKFDLERFYASNNLNYVVSSYK